MHYHFGLGVGHLYVHRPVPTLSRIPEGFQGSQDSPSPGCETGKRLDVNQDADSDIYNPDDPELGLEDRDLEGWEDVESSEKLDGADGADEDSEEEYFPGI